MGAEVNAGTGKETTSVYSRFLDRHLDAAFDVLADMVLRPAYPDIDSERQVVIEEIAMYEDEPQDKVHDILSEAIFGDHPLGRPDHRPRRGGRRRARARDRRLPRRPLPWRANIVVAAAGNVDHDGIVALVEDATGSTSDGDVPAPEPAPAEIQPRLCFHAKETEQYHLCLGGQGLPRGDDRRFALRVLDTDPRRLDLVAALPGGAREARPGLLRLLVLEPVHRHRPCRHLRRHASRQRRRGRRR